MTQRKSLKLTLVWGLFFISLGGFGLHWFIHIKSPLTAFNGYNGIPFVAGLLSVLVIPWLFLSKKTIHAGYLLNGMAAIIGIITMAVVLGKPLVPDIILCFAKFALGKAAFDLEFLSPDPEAVKTGKFYRYPAMGFWYIHLVLLSLVYFLGTRLGG